MSNIETIFMRDPMETGHRLRYIVAEMLICFGWPMAVTVGVYLATGNYPASTIIGMLILLMPLIRLRVAVMMASRLAVKDPRHLFRTISFWYDGILWKESHPLKIIRMYGALSRSLDVIYNYFGRFGFPPADVKNGWWKKVSRIKVVNKLVLLWTDFWINMPVAQDVRSRAQIIADEYYRLAKECNGRLLVLEIAGGHLQPLIIGLSRALREGVQFEYKVVSIEPETEFSTARALELIDANNLERSSFIFIASCISTCDPDRKIGKILADNGFVLSDFDVVTCIGLGDYYRSQAGIRAFLAQFVGARRIIVANISQNLTERFHLHYFIQWPLMKYRSMQEWVVLIKEMFKGRMYKVVVTRHKIFNIAVIK